MNKIKASLFATILVLSTFLAACGSPEEDSVEEVDEVNEVEVEKVNIFTTIYPLQFFAEQIGGEFVEVTNIIPLGGDAHTYEPTAKTMTDMVEGDMFIYNGAGMEGFADAIVDILSKENVKIVKAVEGIELRDYAHDHGHDHDEHGHDHDDHAHDDHGHSHDDHGHDHDDHGHEHEETGHSEEHDHQHGDEDPHVWLDPILAIQLAENIKVALIELLPEQTELFNTNYEALKVELEELDSKFRTMVEGASKDTFIVSHAGYGYWEERYGINQIGVSGISPTHEPSIQQIQAIIELAKENGVEYIAFEQNIPTGNAETVKREANLEVVYIHNLESLTQENTNNNEDYFSLMRKNIQSLKQLLQ